MEGLPYENSQRGGRDLSDWHGRQPGCCKNCLDQLLAGWQAPALSNPIWLGYALLARSARHDSSALTLNDAGLTTFAAARYPFWPNCVLAVQLVFTDSEERQPHVFELHLLDESGTLRDWASEFLPPLDPAECQSQTGVTRASILVPLENRIAFESAGRYALALICDGVTLASLPLSVRTADHTRIDRVNT